MLGLFSLLSYAVGLAHFRYAAVSTCLSVQHSKSHASSNLSLLCLPSLLTLVLWPCLFFHVCSSVSNFLSFDSATLFGFYRSSLNRSLSSEWCRCTELVARASLLFLPYATFKKIKKLVCPKWDFNLYFLDFVPFFRTSLTEIVFLIRSRLIHFQFIRHTIFSPLLGCKCV